MTLAFIFMLFTGDWTVVNWVGAAACAVVAGAVSVPMTRMRMFDLRLRGRWLRAVPAALLQVFEDFAIVTLFLVRSLKRGERGHGRFVARGDFPAGASDAEGTTWRAFVAVTSTVSPNSYVIDIDPDSGSRLSHDLTPNRRSEQPA